MAVTAKTTILDSTEEFAFAQETSANGSAATTGAFVEPCQDSQVTHTVQFRHEVVYVGGAAGQVDIVPMQREAKMDVTTAFRVCSFPASGLLAMLGNGAEATGVVAGGFYPHTGTPALYTNKCPTFTLWQDTGDGSELGSVTPANPIQMAFGTVESFGLSLAENTEVTAKVGLACAFPTKTAIPASPTFIGAGTVYTPKKLYAFTQGSNTPTFNIRSGAGTSAIYSNIITSLDLNLTRETKAHFGINKLDVQDITQKELMLSGSFTALYDGTASNKVYDDYLNMRANGTSANPNQLILFDSAGGSLEIDFQVFQITDVQRSKNGGAVEIQVSWEAFNDLSVLVGASPALSVVSKVIINNLISTSMLSY